MSKWRIFNTHGCDSELNSRSGALVEVLRPLTESEADLCETGPMYEVRFADGFETDVFEDELQEHSEIYHRDYDISRDEQLDMLKKKYEDMGYKAVFIEAGTSVTEGYRVVLYNKDTEIPKAMQAYKNKFVRFCGHWVRETLLGICDRCGNYDELIRTCKEGHLCCKCADDLERDSL